MLTGEDQASYMHWTERTHNDFPKKDHALAQCQDLCSFLHVQLT